MLQGAFFNLLGKKDEFDFFEDKERLKNVLGCDFMEELNEKRDSLFLELNLFTFEQQCQMLNDLLMDKKLFLKVSELKKKIRYLNKKTRPKNLAQKNLSACVEEGFNGFEIVKKLLDGERKKSYKQLDVFYKPVGKIDEIVNYYFSPSMRQAYHVLRSRGK